MPVRSRPTNLLTVRVERTALSTPDLHHAIDEVAWARLFHAYGPALDTPGHLHNLVDGRQLPDAAWHFESAIVHQSTLWSASPDAFRLLVRVMRERELPADIVDRFLDTLTEATDNFDKPIQTPTAGEVEAALNAWENDLATARDARDDGTIKKGRNPKEPDQRAYEAFLHRQPEAWDLIRYANSGVRRLKQEVLALIDELKARGAGSPPVVAQAREAWGG